MTVSRASMTPARKRRIHKMRDGLCGDCGQPVPVLGKGVVYDHRGVLWITGDDSDEAIWPLHKACDQVKTPRDLRTVAKIKRLIRKADRETRKASSLRGRPFSKQHRPLGSKTLKRSFTGAVVARRGRT